MDPARAFAVRWRLRVAMTCEVIAFMPDLAYAGPAFTTRGPAMHCPPSPPVGHPAAARFQEVPRC